MSYNKRKKDYMQPSRSGISINEPTTELQEKILDYICRKGSPDYKSLMKAMGRSRITILQSLRPLIRRHLVEEESQDPRHSTSRRIFKPTDRGLFYSISTSDSVINGISKVHTIPKTLEIYLEVAKGGLPWPPETEEERIRTLVTNAIQNDLFDNYGRSMIRDEKDVWKYTIKGFVLRVLQNKNSDIENVFSATAQVLSYDFGLIPGDVIPIFKRIRNDLDDLIKDICLASRSEIS